MTKQPKPNKVEAGPKGVFAIARNPLGKVVATASDFGTDKDHRSSLYDSQRRRALLKLKRATVKNLCPLSVVDQLTESDLNTLFGSLVNKQTLSPEFHEINH
jgi:hypothetical protein